MNAIIADFVGLLGPGQIVDRHALVAVPAGFLKVIICNSVSDSCLIVSEFKENLNDSSLGIKIIVKAYLCIENDVIEAVSIPFNQRQVAGLDRNIQVLKFAKSLRRRGETLVECDQEVITAEEVLQICVYTLKKNNRSKQLLGFVHISLDNIASLDSALSSNVDAWYKVFPSTSFVAGCPIIKGNQHHINSSIESTTPTSPVSSDILSWVSTSPTRKSEVPSSSASDCTNEMPMKRNSFRNVAKTLVKLLQVRKNGSSSSLSPSGSQNDLDEASTSSALERSSSSKSLMFSSNNNLRKRPKSESAFSEKLLRKDTRNRLKNRVAFSFVQKKSMRMESLLRLKFRRSYNEQSLQTKSRFRRCEEVICSSSEQTPLVWGGKVASVDSDLYFGEVTTSTVNQTQFVGVGIKTLSLSRKPNSVGSESVDLSSTETEELNINQNKSKAVMSLKVASSVFTWAQKVQKKAKFQTLPPPMSPQSDEDFVFPEHDNVYDVLKFLKTLSPSSNGEKEACEKTANSFSHNDVTKSDTSLNSFTEEKAVTESPVAPVTSLSIIDSNDYFEKTDNHICSRTAECQRKREKFANNRSTALSDSVQLGCSLLSVATQRLSMSDDDYVTCSERLSSTNLSIVSCYTTSSERR